MKIKSQRRAFSGKSQCSGSDYFPAQNLSEFTVMANRIRIIALGCKNRDVLSCEFGNEFAPRVEAYLRECFDKTNVTSETEETNKGEDYV